MTIDSGQVATRRGIPADTFAHRLMLTRAHAGHLSIREAADLCGLGRGAWTNWEKGAQPVGVIDIAEAISDKLGVDRDWLLFGGALSEPQSRPLRRRMVRPNAGSGASPDWAMSGAPRTDNRPIGRSVRESTRPVSAVPATRRRPAPIRSASRRMAA